MKEKDWDSLLQSLAQGNCILFLGPDAFEISGSERQKAARSLAATLANSLDDPGVVADPENLAHVAQLYHDQEGRSGLEAAVDRWLDSPEKLASPIHPSMVQLPFRLILTTMPDDSTVQAFEDAPDKTPIGCHYSFRGSVGLSQEGISNLRLPEFSENAPVVYSLLGSVKHPYSMVLTENDLLDFLIAVIRGQPMLPVNLTSALTSAAVSFLFVGFGFHQWHWRLLLRVLRQTQANNRSFAWDLNDSNPTTASYFRHGHKLAIFKGEPEQFMDKLLSKYKNGRSAKTRRKVEAVPTLPAWCRSKGRKPVAFLSYARDSADAVGQVMGFGEQLQSAGIDVWRDTDSLRGGDRWYSEIGRVIRDESDYFILCVTHSLLERTESYVFDELETAKERIRRISKRIKFIIPVRIDDVAWLEEASEYHHFDFFENNEAAPVVTAIQRDWQLRKKT